MRSGKMFRCEEGITENNTTAQMHNFWSILGGISGGVLGFIVENVPGMVAGIFAGNRLGVICNSRGRSVFAVFQNLPVNDKTRVLSQLASRVFSHAFDG